MNLSKRPITHYLIALVIWLFSFPAFSEGLVTNLSSATPDEYVLIMEHVYLGIPGDFPLLVRRGYVSSYDEAHRVPKWVCFHVAPDYRNTPPRKGRFSSFRIDPDMDNPVKPKDYNGLLESQRLARGHMAPYAAMGGDRDQDGKYASDDKYDAQTVYEANYMSNIAPQNQDGLNGSGGLWYKLERYIQDKLVTEGQNEVWVTAGTIFTNDNPEVVGPQNDIGVPDQFFQIVTYADPNSHKLLVLAFLFPHLTQPEGTLPDYLTSIDKIEEVTGLDFFRNLPDDAETDLEQVDTKAVWNEFHP